MTLKSNTKKCHHTLLAICGTSLGTLSAASVVLPIMDEGDSELYTPLHSAGRVMQVVYASSILGDIPYGSQITGMAFRLDAGDLPWPSTAVTWQTYNIQLSTSLHTPGSLSFVFDNNIGSDVVMVRSGSLTFSAGDFPGRYPGRPSPYEFGPEIEFSTPYTYMGGDLLITIRHSPSSGQGGAAVDAVRSRSGFYQTILSDTGGHTNPEANPQPLTFHVPIIRFTVVPEPSTASVLVTGIFASLLRRRG